MHVYAPGGRYTPITLRIQPQPFVTVQDVMYPPPQTYLFEPLNELSQVVTANRFGSCSA